MEYNQLNFEMQKDQNSQEMSVRYSSNGKSNKGKKGHAKKRKSVLDLEEQMFKAEAHYTKSILQSILESAIEYSIVGTDLPGTILLWNEGAHCNYGYQADELIHKKNIRMLHAPEDIESGVVEKFMQEALEEGKAEGIFQRVRKDGSRFTASVTLSIRRDDENNPIGYAMISRDITEAKRIENELIKSNEELEQFAYITSHDLKAPLRAIQRLACWIEEDNKDKLDEKSKENLMLLRKRSIRLAKLIDGILQYSRAGRVDLNIETVDTQEILQDIVDSLNPDGRFKIKYPKNFPIFETAKTPLIQVISNLIGNSIKHHHRKNGTISIDIDTLGSFYLFTVKDDGPGIDPEYFDKIFVVFQTLKSRDELEATGIGLSIVKKIVESQGGKVMVQSHVGHGTTMSFTWPKYVKKIIVDN